MLEMTPDKLAWLLTLTVAAVFLVGVIMIVIWLQR
jgi:hypothetical protein